MLIAATLTLAIGLAALVSSRQPISQTTLIAAWWWALAALLAWTLVEIAAAALLPIAIKPWQEPLRLAAVALTFCPVVALIGAKRPQHGPWNFVVLALWAIVALPAAEAFFLRRGQPIDMGDARGWFLWILILLTPINYLPTRFWLSSLLLALGQTLALAPYLPLLHDVGRSPASSHFQLLALHLAATALLTAWAIARTRRKTTNPYDLLWLNFRDTFGLFWSLRVQERINTAAQQYNGDLTLTWPGFRHRTNNAPLSAIDAAIEPMLRTTFKSLLRRFVSNRWITERLEAPPD
jgi:hypothetical protein